jgi:PAS domain S-box-containing protein
MDNERSGVWDNTARLRRNLRTVSRWNRELFQARSEQDLLQSICQILVETAEVDLAWIGYREDDGENTVRPIASAGNGADDLARVHHPWDPTLARGGPVGEAIRTGHYCWVEDIRTDLIFSNARTEALALGYVSCVAFPLVAHTRSGGLLDQRGVLTLYARRLDTFDESDIGLYAELASYLACMIGGLRRQLADDVSLGIKTLLKRGERKRLEEALQSSERRLRLITDTLPTLAWSALPDGSNAFVSQRWSEYTGISAEEAAGSGWQAAFHPEDIGKHTEKWRASLATGQPFENEARLRRAADGEYRWFLIHSAPLRDEPGDIVRWYGTATDIEDRKGAEQALRRSEAFLADAQKISHTGSWAYDVASGRMIHSSEEFHRLFGFDPAADILDPDEWVRRIHPDDRERAIETMAQKMRERMDYEVDYRTVHPDGAIKYVHGLAHPVLSPSGDLVEIVGSSIDVTERKRAEQVLLNLMINAVEAMSSESNRLRELLIVTGEDGSNGVRVAVSDSGPGVGQESLERLFDAFYTTKSAGMGMGPAICRSIIETHGGRVWATPNTPRGAIFQFQMPT